MGHENDERPQLSKEDQERLLGHEYDGIQELDHQLPRWWLGTFFLTIAFGVPYFIYYVLGPGPTLMQEHNARMEVINKEKAAKALAEGAFDQGLYDKIVAEGGVEKGKVVFETNCVACHKDLGIGDIGPNLTDAYWIHGKGHVPDLYNVVANGVEDKGMPVWKEVLSKEEVYQAVAYVSTLRNKKLAGKEPQGELIQE